MEQTRLAEDEEMQRFLSGLNAFREEEDVHASTRDVHRSTPVPQSSGPELTRGSWSMSRLKKDATCSGRRDRLPHLLHFRSNFSLLKDISAGFYRAWRKTEHHV